MTESSDRAKLNVSPNVQLTNNLNNLLIKRSSIKGRVTKFKGFVNNYLKLDSVSPTDLLLINHRFEKFRELSFNFEDLQSQIEILNSSNLDTELDVREQYEQDFATVIAQTQIFLDKQNDAKSTNCQAVPSNKSDDSFRHKVSFKLPIIQIMKFDGSYSKWIEFRDTFSSLIHNNDNMDSIHKFHYLNSYLEGEASRVISNMEISSQNYQNAWELLCERYNNEKQLIKNHLNSLCNIQPVSRDSAKSLRFLIDHVSKNLRALKSLGEYTDSWDTLVIHLVSAKLDNSTSFKWEEYRNDLSSKPKLQDFYNFLKGRADIIESIQCNKSDKFSTAPSSSQSMNNINKQKFHAKSFTISARNGGSTSSLACVFCNGNHRAYDCASFLSKSVEDRITEASQLKLCMNCLRKGHPSRQCRLGPCSKCKGRHNTLLHRDLSQVVNQSNSHTNLSVSNTKVNQDSDDNVLQSLSLSANNGVLLSTVLIEIYNPTSKKYLTIRALLDSGSQSSLITVNLVNKLQLTPQPTQVDIVGVGNVSLTNSIQRCIVQIKSKHSKFKTELSCLVLPQISGNLPNKSFDISQIKLPPNMKLADPNFHQSAPIDILIGADLVWSLIENEQIYLGPIQPILRKSKLGWILAGPFYNKSKTHKSHTILCNHAEIINNNDTVTNETLNQSLTKFWELEQVPRSCRKYTEQEVECENHFLSNTYRKENGRFCLKLPLISSPDCLGDSFKIAKRQFLSLEKRLNKNHELKQLYKDFVKEYSDLGHLSESPILIPTQSYFIPHHAVLKPTSESTKLRVVFNGGQKTTSGYSVNDIQMVGPHIQDNLFNILLRFRQYTYVLSGDIEKMYRQCEMQDSDRNLQMILWRDSETESIRSLRLNTVTYGYASSSFLSTRCLWQLGEECPDVKIKQIIQNDFVVDDLLTGSDEKEELLYIKQTVEKSLSAGCFNLRKYRSNLPSLLYDSQNIQHNLVISSSSHILGVGWNPNEDMINFPDNYKPRVNAVTKRSILSDTCKIFDPLGLLSAVTIKPKILIKKLWVNNLAWDEPVPNEIYQAWLNFVNSIEYLQNLQIPRHALCDSPSDIELHCFCDASKEAYGACIYLKSTNKKGVITVRLLCAKARVVSVKPTTIPRLELCACLLGAQLAGAVCRALRCIITRKLFWTDSSIALSWLGMKCNKLKTFVANRVDVILDLTTGSTWRHVPTHLNPADLASRGIDANKINNFRLWWNGPTFLRESESSWPSLSSNKTLNVEELPEIKCNVVNISVEGPPIVDFERYSKLSFLKNTIAYVLRFIHNCKNPRNKLIGSLQPKELKSSFETLFKFSQQESFETELKILQSKKTLSSKNPLIPLNPFLDENNILRVGGRLEYSCYSFEKRHPMLLHGKHKLTKLLFQQKHLHLLHAGPQLLLSSIREFVWPIAGRDLARTTARQCVICRRASGKAQAPIMGMLPKQRVNPGYPFASTGVDFAGPFLITDRKGRGCKISKCYLCVFVCFKYKCLHLEAVSELSKDAFIMCLRRFISRRGRPVEIFCDNGRNFVAAAREIGEFLISCSDDIRGFSSEEGIKFNFQPAYAPHFGGLWEASVKSAKYHLKRVLGTTHMTFEELATLFSQIEAILNSRPLSPLSSSPKDYQPLTPGHFLIGRPLMALPTPNLEGQKTNSLDRFQRLEQSRQHFWRRWQAEYITQLQQRQKWRVPRRALQVGDLVLLKEENTPPMSWRLGRISSLFPARDGVVRVVEVKTPTGVFRRGVRYLCPLLDAEEDALEADSSKAPQDVAANGQ